MQIILGCITHPAVIDFNLLERHMHKYRGDIIYNFLMMKEELTTIEENDFPKHCEILMRCTHIYT